MNICLFKPEEINSTLSLRDPRAEHIIKILHKKEGETFSAGIIDGPSGKATITEIVSKECTTPDGRKTFTDGYIKFNFTAEGDGKPLYPLIMIIGFPRPIQLKRLLRDMAGLGTMSIHLVVTELGEKSYLKSDLATSDAGYEMLYEGTEQAAGTHIPKLYMHQSLAECMNAVDAELKTLYSNKQFTSSPMLLALDNINPVCSLGKFINSTNSIEQKDVAVAAIGSERGWTNKERTMLEEYGFKRLSMGKRVLRTETAATVAASIILDKMGYLD